MSHLDAIIFGLVQGLTEFLPVSSSGHLALARALTGSSAQNLLAFDVALHLATLLAVLVAFRASLLELLGARRRWVLLLMLATAPLGLVLLPVGEERHLKDLVELFAKDIRLVGLGFLATAALLLFSRRFERASESESHEPSQLDVKDALLIGIAQLFAVLPGVSRAGSTITIALARGAAPEPACEFAFLLSIPAVLGAVALEARNIHELTTLNPGPIASGFTAAFLTGLAAIGAVRWLVERQRLWLFAPYLLACAALSFALGG
jgi:undecaprenyl-diphosphatase